LWIFAVFYVEVNWLGADMIFDDRDATVEDQLPNTMAKPMAMAAFSMLCFLLGVHSMNVKPQELNPKSPTAIGASAETERESDRRLNARRRRQTHTSMHHSTAGTVPSRRRRGPVPNRQGEYASDEDVAIATGVMAGMMICMFGCCCMMAKAYRKVSTTQRNDAAFI